MDFNNIRQELNPSSPQHIQSLSSSTYNSCTSKSNAAINNQSLQNQNEQKQISLFQQTADSYQYQQSQNSLSEIFKKQEHQLGDTNFKFIKYNPQVTFYSVIISTIFTLGVFAYMILFRVQMFNFSLEFIEKMQENRNIFITSFMNFISLCVSPKPVISLLVIFFALSTQKLKILTFLLYYGFLVYTCVTLKSLFGDPRPYWIESSYETDLTKSQQNINQYQQEKSNNHDYQNLIINESNQQHQNQSFNSYNVSSHHPQQLNKNNINGNLMHSHNSDEVQLPQFQNQDKTFYQNISQIEFLNPNTQSIQKSFDQNQKIYNNNQQSYLNLNPIQPSENISFINNQQTQDDKIEFRNTKQQYDYQIENRDRVQSNNSNINQNQMKEDFQSGDIKEIRQIQHKKELNNINKIEQSDKQNTLQTSVSQENQNLQKNNKNQSNNNITKQQLASNYDHIVIPLDWKCYQEYGNPSGHAFLGIPLYEFIVRDYLLRKLDKNQKLFRTLVVVAAVIFINLILLSRMYLGMHSLNQVIFGGVLGIYATVFYRLVCERRISQMLYSYVQLKRRNAFKQILQVILLTLVIFSFPIILYSIQNYVVNNSSITQSQEKQWEKVIQQKCGQFDPMQSFRHKCFIDSSVVAICFSIVLGFLLTSREKFLKGQYKEAPGLKYFLLRLIIIFGCCSTITIFYYVIPNANNPYIKYLNLFLGVFITGFLLVALVPKLFEKYELIFIIYPLLQESNGYVLNKQYPLQESINPQQFIQSSQQGLQLTL